MRLSRTLVTCGLKAFLFLCCPSDTLAHQRYSHSCSAKLVSESSSVSSELRRDAAGPSHGPHQGSFLGHAHTQGALYYVSILPRLAMCPAADGLSPCISSFSKTKDSCVHMVQISNFSSNLANLKL